MTRIMVEVRDLREVEPALLRKLKRCSFGDGGWMVGCIDQILRGYMLEAVWESDGDGDGHMIIERQPVVYNKAHAVMAWDGDELVGWAMVRHPSKRIRLAKRVWEHEEGEYRTKYEYGGRRDDFMVYVKQKYRKQRVARTLLLVAYNNFGRMDAYPHDRPSERFYQRNARFVTAHHTEHFSTTKYKTREVL